MDFELDILWDAMCGGRKRWYNEALKTFLRLCATLAFHPDFRASLYGATENKQHVSIWRMAKSHSVTPVSEYKVDRLRARYPMGRDVWRKKEVA